MTESDDPEGLRVFYYLVQDLKALVFSLISLHFKVLSILPLCFEHRLTILCFTDQAHLVIERIKEIEELLGFWFDDTRQAFIEGFLGCEPNYSAKTMKLIPLRPQACLPSIFSGQFMSCVFVAAWASMNIPKQDAQKRGRRYLRIFIRALGPSISNERWGVHRIYSYRRWYFSLYLSNSLQWQFGTNSPSLGQVPWGLTLTCTRPASPPNYMWLRTFNSAARSSQ